MNDKDDVKPPVTTDNIDVVNVDIQAHLLITDADTGEILLNKRG